MSATPTPTPAARIRRAERSLVVMFFTHGFILATMIPRIPEFIERIGVNFATWGLIMGFAGLGSLLGLTQTTRLVSRFGTRNVLRVSSLALPLVAASFPWISSGWVWFAANALFMFVGSCFNISVNAQAVSLQKLVGKVIIGRYHASWSIGATSSAALSGILAGFMPLELHYTLIPALVLASFWLAGRELLTRQEEPASETKSNAKRIPFLKTPKYVWLLTAGLFTGVFPEIVMADWSAVFAKTTLHLDATLGAIPYAVFTGAMIVGRLSIGRLTKAFHFSELSKWGGIIGSLSMLAGLLIAPPIALHDPILALLVISAFWIVAGLGCAPMVPSFFSAAGHVKGMNTAAVLSRMSLVNSIIVIGAKYLMGAMAEGVGLAVALLVPTASFFIAGLIAGAVVKRAKRREAIANAFPPTGPISLGE